MYFLQCLIYFNPQEWKQLHQAWTTAKPLARGEIVGEILGEVAVGLMIDHTIENEGLVVRKLLRINFSLEEALNYEICNNLSLIGHYVKHYKLDCEALLKEINNFIEQTLFRLQKSFLISSKNLRNDLDDDDNDYEYIENRVQSPSSEYQQIQSRNMNISSNCYGSPPKMSQLKQYSPLPLRSNY